MLMDAGKRQKYGTQVIKNGQNEWELYPVDNIDSVNKRRRALGLSSTQEYLNNFH